MDNVQVCQEKDGRRGTRRRAIGSTQATEVGPSEDEKVEQTRNTPGAVHRRRPGGFLRLAREGALGSDRASAK